MLFVFIVVVFLPIMDGQTLFEVGMDKIIGASTSEQSTENNN